MGGLVLLMLKFILVFKDPRKMTGSFRFCGSHYLEKTLCVVNEGSEYR
jgi:hypothetical protein